MKLTALLFLLSLTAYGQRKFIVSEIWAKPSGDSTITKNLVTKVIAPKDGLKIRFSTPIDTARLFLPDDGRQYVFEGTWKLQSVSYDTSYSPIETIEPTDTRFKVVNMTTFTNSPKPGISAKSFAAVTDPAKAAIGSVDFVGAMIDLNSERFTGHGTIQVYIDNVWKGNFDQSKAPLQTDVQRATPTFRIKVPMGVHTIQVRNGASGQFIIDNFVVYTIKVQPK